MVWDVNLSISGVIENHFDVGEMLALFSITSSTSTYLDGLSLKVRCLILLSA